MLHCQIPGPSVQSPNHKTDIEQGHWLSAPAGQRRSACSTDNSGLGQLLVEKGLPLLLPQMLDAYNIELLIGEMLV